MNQQLSPKEPLSPPERRVLAHAAGGLSHAETAEVLGVSERTVRRHMERAADKLGTRGITHTVAVAISRGLITPGEPTPSSREPSREDDPPAPPTPEDTIPQILAALPGVRGNLPRACKAAGIGYSTVHGWLSRDPDLRKKLRDAGWKPGKRGPSRRMAAALDTVVAELARGATVVQAAEIAGISAPMVSYHVGRDPELAGRIDAARRQGRRHRRPRIDHEDLVAAVRDGVTIAQYAKRLGISRGMLYQIIGDAPQLQHALEQARAARRATRPPEIESFLTLLRENPKTSIRAAAGAAGISIWRLNRLRSLDADLDAHIRQVLAQRLREPAWLAPLLAALENGATFKTACQMAGIHFVTAYEKRREYPELDDQVRAAIDKGRSRKDSRRWRQGARDAAARRAHNAETRADRRRKSLAGFTAQAERDLLAALRDGTPLTEAAAQAGVPFQALFGRARWDAAWATRLDQALMAGRDPGLRHGTDHTYKAHKCRCPECRQAHARFR